MGDIDVNFNGAEDIATLFSDAVDIPVNFPSDIRGGDVIINGNFDTDTDWTKGAGWTITGGAAVGTAATGLLYQSSLTAGKTYEIIYDITEYTGGTIRAFAGNTGFGTIRSGVGSYSDTILADGSALVGVDGVSAFTGKIDNIRAYQV